MAEIVPFRALHYNPEKTGELARVECDIRGVVEVCHACGAALKVILENAYLSAQEQVTACRIAQNAGVPGVTASADGPNRIKFKVNVAVFTATVIASVTQAGPSTVRFHIISAGGLPSSVLGSFSNMTFSIPKLPYGLTIQSLSVTSQGVVGHVTASNIHFSQ